MTKNLPASEMVTATEKILSEPAPKRLPCARPKTFNTSLKNVMPKAFGHLALLGWLLLLLATALAAAMAMQQLRSVAHLEAQARAQQVADILAGRITRALSVGVPLSELVGVPALFAQRMEQVPGIVGLALVDLSNKPLWLQLPQQSVAQRGPQTPARDAAAAQLIPTGLSVSAPVYTGPAGVPEAQVILVWQDPDAGSLWGKSLLPLMAWPLAVSVLAALALRRSLRGGRMRRSAALQKATDFVQVGDFSQPLPLLRQHEFDSRPAWLAAQLRLVNEQHLRISRLHHSLRQTEPDAARRSDLDAALAFANANQRFRDPQTKAVTAQLLAVKDPVQSEASQNPDSKTRLKSTLQWSARGAAGLCLCAGIVLPLMLAFAPQWLPAKTWITETALVLSALANGTWLAWIFMRSSGASGPQQQHRHAA